MDPMVFVYVYVSSAVTPFTQTELRELLSKCRENNATLGITGLLLTKDGNFMQVLEGPEKSVRDLVAKIRSDPRHRGLITLLEEVVSRHQFPDWKMGFRDLKATDAELPAGYSEFLNTPLTPEEFSNDPTKCHRLILSFKKGQR